MRLRTEVTWIWRRIRGPVTVLVKEGGKKEDIRSNALIPCLRRIRRDIKMRQAFNPDIVPSSTAQPHGGHGEMIRYAQAIGADSCTCLHPALSVRER